ncbi:hypothetical protein [Mesorhizobium sp. M2A.F.Ca.ET.039.01.1.1]|uniref:hypothetical protein n=1 Tax=Mesorhizobium sp. M2A.F.Ca.ET.039.01.1.1 TaxID=2496746 RepID=UPI000FCC79F8|nr:hypothetical protein [Mesorhizobium sp. M2A.F.Ca.ET.039.01.1.1]RWX72529.1 hypothetical protein EOA24_00620 [Mesorhizobium sp. M2A.F.Ca.ET.039.01.1.1]
MSTVNLGDRVKDTITGFAGIATGRADYLTGCTQFCITPPVKEDGTTRDSHWYDEDRIEVVEAGAVKIAVKRPGGPSDPSERAPTR